MFVATVAPDTCELLLHRPGSELDLLATEFLQNTPRHIHKTAFNKINDENYKPPMSLFLSNIL